MAEETSYERLMNGTSWNEFCDLIKVAGFTILRDSSPQDPLNRAEGFRYLARLTRTGLESFLEHRDPAAPTLHRPVHETVKIGADNPDNYYQNAMISGAHEYRLIGPRGTVSYLGFGTYAGGYGSEGRSAETGYLEGKDLEVSPDGTVEILLSCEKKPGNWLPMEPDTSTLHVRQTYLDRDSESLADLRIERLDGDRAPSPITPESVDTGLTMAARLVVGVAAMFANWAEGFAEQVNELPLFDPGVSLAAHGDPNITYYHGYWRVAPDEALVVEVTPPACDYWNFQLNNHWMESLDYTRCRISINKHQAHYESDGTVRLVVAHRDPGVPNWLQTADHDYGTMCFRWIRAAEQVQPRARLVKLDTL